MATWFFDSVNGSNANAGTSASAPKRTYDEFVTSGGYGSSAVGDSFLFRRGTEQPLTDYRSVRGGTDKGFESYYGVYGTSINGSSKVRWYAAGAVQYGIMLNFAGTHDIIVEDFEVDAGGPYYVTSAFYCAAQTTDTYRNTFRRCDFHHSRGSGMGVGRENNSAFNAWGYVFEHCNFYDNAAHGLVLGGLGHRVTKCKAYRNGASMSWGGHGFSSLYNRTEMTSGWTLVSGTTYSRALPAHVVDVHFCDYNNNHVRLTKNTSTPTTPSSGQFGFAAGVLYINTGAAAPSVSMYAWGKCDLHTYDMCEAYDNIRNLSAPYWEGHGFAFDDYTSNSVIKRCISRDNEGLGYSINRGDGNLIISSVAKGNGLPAVVQNGGSSNSVRSCTFVDNNRSPASGYTADTWLSGDSNSVLSCISQTRTGDAAYALYGPSSASFAFSLYAGYTAEVSGGAVAIMNVAVTPLLDDAFVPLAAAAQTGAYNGALNSRDFYGAYYPTESTAMCFGAVQVPTVVRARTSSRRRSLTRRCVPFREHAWVRKACAV